jgi:hypothetical protein
MKTRLLLLFLFLVLFSCSDKDTRLKYTKIKGYYTVLTSLIDFVIQDQQSVSTDGLVTIVETDPPTYRKATFDDELNAVKVSMTAAALGDYVDEIMENCDKIIAISSKKRLFMSKDDKVMLKTYSEFIKIREDGILKLTDGKTAKDFLLPFVPRTMWNSLDEYGRMYSVSR